MFVCFFQYLCTGINAQRITLLNHPFNRNKWIVIITAPIKSTDASYFVNINNNSPGKNHIKKKNDKLLYNNNIGVSYLFICKEKL